MKMSDVQSHVSPQTNLRNRMLSNSRKTEKNGYSMIPFTQNSKTVKTEKYFVKITVCCLGNHWYLVKL